MAAPSGETLIGRQIGPYRVCALLGTGGMGEVYRASDGRLGREVAIKVLPAEFSQDDERLRRFEQEACTAGMLNHPNIVTVHDVGLFEGMPYIVSEVLEGETLRARLAREPMPVRLSVDFAMQIVQGLAAVHEKAIIHRDLKPENLFVTRDGRIKILDFGLAKLKHSPQRAAGSNAPTNLDTQHGVVLGTVGYMSPEQVRGQDADHRSDIFSFGAIFYEMLTGNRAFQGDSDVEVLNAILKHDPLTVSQPENRQYDAGQERVLRRSLEKEPRRRFQSASDLGFAIEALAPESSSSPKVFSSAPKGRKTRNPSGWLGWILSALLATALAVTLGSLYFRTPATLPELRLDVITPPGTDPTSAAISPDGRRLIFVSSANGRPQLWQRSLETGTMALIPETEGATYPFWSSDSHSVGFFAGNRLKRIDIAGGRPQSLWNAPSGRGGSWNAQGVIVFSPSTVSPLLRISESGGEASPVTELGEGQTNHRFPFFLPNGRQFLFYSGGAARGIYLGSLDRRETKLVVLTDTPGAYLTPGWLVFLRESVLLAQRFDAAHGVVSGETVKLADIDPRGTAAFSVSAAGMVAYGSGRPDKRQLAWFDRTGTSLGTVGEPDDTDLGGLELSHDGRRVAVHRTTQNTRGLWLLEVEGKRSTKFTVGPARQSYPVWSPDDSSIAFVSAQGKGQILRKPSNPSGTEELLMEPTNVNPTVPDDWSPDSRFILLYHLDRKTSNIDEWLLPMDGDRKPFPYLDKPYEERHGQFSPDGKWVAYTSDQGGQYQIYVSSFPKPDHQATISTSGGIQPRWSHDGKEIFYIAPDGKLMAVPVTVKGATLEGGTPKSLFQTRIWGGGANVEGRRQYAVAKDGRFLINVTVQETGSPITLLLNWKSPAK
jgi:serine/threonine protein kinase